MQFKEFSKYLFFTFVSYFLIAILFFIYLTFKEKSPVIHEIDLLRFDAKLYLKISENGYSGNWLCAFFPAFPFLWQFFHASVIGITITNSIIFILSYSALAYMYRFDWKRFLYFITIPSLVFMFVPYSEALFYLAATMILIGLAKDNLLLILMGFFIASIVRPTTFVFIPAIAGTFLLTSKNFKEGFGKSLIPILILILGLGLTITIHYYYTNTWFVFFEAQKIWENYLHLPKLPFTSWGGDASLRYDGSVLAITSCCLFYLYKTLQLRMKFLIAEPKELIFSLFYIIGTALLILLYRDGNLYSLNRFVYATPFILIVLNYFFRQYTFKAKDVWIILIGTEVLWLLLGSYNHIHNFLMFTTVTIYFIVLLFTKHTSKLISNLSIITLIAINLIGLIKLYYRYINGGWVG